MKAMIKTAAYSVLISMLLNVSSYADINFGVQAPRGTIKAMAKWSDLGVYLTAKTGQKVSIIPLSPGISVAAVEDGKVEYMLSNPVLAFMLKEKQGAKLVATMNTKAGSQFSGVIITGKDTGITSSAGLKGKNVMGFKFKKSAGAYVFQVKHMKDQGIDPHKDFASFKQAKRQDEIVLAVKNGLIDGGFVKSGLLESMVEEKRISWNDIVILDEKSDGFKKKHSTALYPNWTVIASKNADTKITEKIKKALLALTPKDAASKKSRINGFIDPLPLTTLAETLKALNLPPYN